MRFDISQLIRPEIQLDPEDFRRISYEARDAVKGRLQEAERVGDEIMAEQWLKMLKELCKIFAAQGWEM